MGSTKRTVLAGVAVAMAAVLTASCGGGQPEAPAGTGAATSGPTATVVEPVRDPGAIGTGPMAVYPAAPDPIFPMPEVLRGVVVRAGNDVAEWPPYFYQERVGGQPTEHIMGYTVDVLAEVFGLFGIPFTIELLPWNRVLAEVAIGTRLHMFSDASYSEERNAGYLLSRPYYSTHGYYYWSRKYFPDGIAVATATDLKRFRVAGVLGYNYSHYSFAPGELDQKAKSFPAVLQQLQRGYYDVTLENYETLVGYSAIGENLLADPDIGYAPVPGMEPVSFYMMFARNDIGAALKEVVDRGLAELEARGELENLLRRYVPLPK